MTVHRILRRRLQERIDSLSDGETLHYQALFFPYIWSTCSCKWGSSTMKGYWVCWMCSTVYRIWSLGQESRMLTAVSLRLIPHCSDTGCNYSSPSDSSVSISARLDDVFMASLLFSKYHFLTLTKHQDRGCDPRAVCTLSSPPPSGYWIIYSNYQIMLGGTVV